MNDHKYTWTFPEDSLVIRAYVWLWEGDPSTADFCKLFWRFIATGIHMVKYRTCPAVEVTEKVTA